MKLDKKRILVIGIAICIFTLLIGVLVGHFCEFDWTAVSLVITNIIVVSIFVTTFLVIDSNNIKKEENKRKIAYSMIYQDFLDCEAIANVLKEKMSKQEQSFILENFDVIKKEPFVYNNEIYQLALDGIILKKDFVNYTRLKSYYEMYLNSLIFNSEDEYNSNERKEYLDIFIQGYIQTHKEDKDKFEI